MHATRDPVVLIHGIFGWGLKSPLFNLFPCYWPRDEIAEINPNHIIVQVGKVSSDHDRACEAFYQLYGGRVDYGETHSCKYGHHRYGSTYAAAHPKWSEVEAHPVHLLGHSFGGTTALELYQMICRDFFGVGSNYKWVKSITTVASPLTGSTLGSALGAEADTPVPVLSGAHLLAIKVGTFWKASTTFLPILKHIFDYQLDQWKGIASWDVLYSTRSSILMSQDNALYSSLPSFRIKKNKELIHMDKLHLFSIVTTAKDQHHAPMWETAGLVTLLYVLSCRRQLWPVRIVRAGAWVALAVFMWKKMLLMDYTKARATLWAIMWVMRRYVYSKTEHGLDHKIWVHNDGVVNTYSQVYPRVALNPKETPETKPASSMVRNASYVSVDLENLGAEDDDIAKGQWHIHRLEKNHLCGTFLDADAGEMYKHIFKLLQKTDL
ncbi:unnamed protein product [Aphanomyces euteiches]